MHNQDKKVSETHRSCDFILEEQFQGEVDIYKMAYLKCVRLTFDNKICKSERSRDRIQDFLAKNEFLKFVYCVSYK